jgi:SpoU rRNA methylase family enzyme
MLLVIQDVLVNDASDLARPTRVLMQREKREADQKTVVNHKTNSLFGQLLIVLAVAPLKQPQ